MPVPKTAVHKDNRVMFPKYDVWPTGKLLVQPETKSGAMEQGANCFLRTRILAPDPRHVPAAVRSAKSIDHPL
jgi:hypothetical protein